MHMNEIIYALICINNHVLACLISMLSGGQGVAMRMAWRGGGGGGGWAQGHRRCQWRRTAMAAVAIM